MIHLVMITAGTGGEADKKHPPLGLLYVGGALKKAGFDVSIHHLLPSEMENCVQELVKDKPLFIGFSVLTGVTTYYAAVMSKRIKEENNEIPIVWGGQHSSLMVQQCLSEDFIDMVCIGEGEETAVELAKALDTRKPLDNILSVGFKKGRNIVINDPRPRIKELDKLNLNWSLLDVESYSIQSPGKKTFSFYSSRGCPFSCGFCSSTKFYGRIWRCHSEAYVMEHLMYLKNRYGFNSIFFSDDNFMVDKNRAYKILGAMAKQGISCDTLDVRVDAIDDSVLSRFEDYGVSGVFFGWESGNDRLLKLMNKGITTEEIFSRARLLAKHPDINVWASGIVSLPTETRQEMNGTIDMALELHRNLPNGTVGIFQYMPLPGTELLRLAVKDGFEIPIRTEDWRIADPQTKFYSASWLDWLTDEDARDLRTMQHLFREYMFNAGRTAWPVARMLNSAFLSLFRLRVKKRIFKFTIDMWLYKHLRNWYQGLLNA